MIINFKDNKGVLFFDFLFSFVVFIIIFAVLFSFLSVNLGNIYSNEENLEERLIADDLASSINSVSLAKPGYSTRVHLEDNVQGYAYTVSVYSNCLVLYDRFNSLKSTILPINIKDHSNNSILKFNLHSGGTYLLTNVKEGNSTYVKFRKIQ